MSTNQFFSYEDIGRIVRARDTAYELSERLDASLVSPHERRTVELSPAEALSMVKQMHDILEPMVEQANDDALQDARVVYIDEETIKGYIDVLGVITSPDAICSVNIEILQSLKHAITTAHREEVPVELPSWIWERHANALTEAIAKEWVTASVEAALMDLRSDLNRCLQEHNG